MTIDPFEMESLAGKIAVLRKEIKHCVRGEGRDRQKVVYGVRKVEGGWW
jgi:hypothetical protein